TGFIAAGSAPASAYTFTTLNNPGDPAFHQLLGINNSGLIAGYFGDGSILPNQGYLLAPPYGLANYTNENVPGSVQTQVTGLNNAGPNPVTVGFYVDGSGNNIGFVNQGGPSGSYTPVANSGSSSFNQLLGVNDHNVAVGFYTDAMGDNYGYTYNIASATFSPDISDPLGV